MGLSDLKITIKSILTSSQKSLTPRELLRDFKELEGYDFPYQKFGFSDFLQCLGSSDMADTVKVQYEGGVQVVLPVASAKSKHIDLLVMKQKSKPAKVRSGRRAPPIPRRAPPPRMSSRAPRFNSKPSSSSYQTNSYRQPVFPNTACYVRQFSNSSSSASTSNYQSNQSYQSHSTLKTQASHPFKDSSFSQFSSCPTERRPGHLSSQSQSKSNKPFVPTYMKDQLIDFLKSKRQGVKEEDMSRFLITKSFRDYGFTTVQCLLNSLPDVIVRKDGYIYLRQEYVQANSSHLSSSAKSLSVVPGGFEDEAYEDGDIYYSDEDYEDDDIRVNGNMCAKESTLSYQQSDGANVNEDMSDEKSLLNCKSRSSVCSFDSDSGCADAANEKMGNRMRQHFQTLLDKYPGGINLINLGHAYKELFNHPLNFEDIGFSSMIEFVANHPSIFFCLRLDQNDDFLVFDAKKEIPSKYKVQAQNRARHKKIPPGVYENMKQLLKSKKTSGLLSTEVEKLYHRKYGTELNVGELGFDSVNSFFIALTDLCYLRPVRQKLRAYPKDLLQESENNSTETEQFHTPMITQQPFPPECCDMNCQILQQQIGSEHLQESEDGSKLFIEILISEVYSPVNFWFHLRLKKPELHNMMDDLDNFYNEDQKNYCMPSSTICIGQICATKYHHDGRWHRVRIRSIPNLHEVTVFYLDYGTVSKVSKSELRFLHKDFEDMPAQAIRGRLRNLKPAEGNRWDQECNEFFLTSTEDRGLMAEVIDIRVKDEITEIEMVLWDTNGEEDVLVNELLIEKGFATYEVPPVSEISIDSDLTSCVDSLTLASNQSETQNTCGSFQHVTLSGDASSNSSNQNDPLHGLQKLNHCERNTSNSTDFEDGVKSIARYWSSENLNEQSTLSSTSNQEPFFVPVDNIKNILRSVVTKIPSMMTTDSICKAMNSTSMDNEQNVLNCVESPTQNETFIHRNTQGANQSFSGLNYPSSLNQQQNLMFQYPHQTFNNPAMNQPPVNYHQSAYAPIDLQNSNLQNPTLNLLPPPGLVSPAFPAGQYVESLNRPNQAPQVLNSQYAFNPFLNQSAQLAQPPNQFYPNYLAQNQPYSNPFLSKQSFPSVGSSNILYQNVPQNPVVGSDSFLSHHRTKFNPNFQNLYASNPNLIVSNPLVDIKNSGYNSYLQNTPSVPLNFATMSAFAPTSCDPLSVRVTPNMFHPQPLIDSSPSVSPVKDLLGAKSSPQSEISASHEKLLLGAEMVSKNQADPSQVNFQTSTPQLSESPPSKEVKETVKEEFIHKVVDQLLQKLKESADAPSKSSQSSNVSDKPLDCKNSSPLAPASSVKAVGINQYSSTPSLGEESRNRNSSESRMELKSPFEVLCEKIKVASSSPTGNSNLLHKFFPQLDSKVDDLGSIEKAGQFSSTTKFKTDSNNSNTGLVKKEFQSDHISSTTVDTDSQKLSWNLTWKQVNSSLGTQSSAVKSQLSLTNDKLTNILPESVESFDDNNYEAKKNLSELNSENQGHAPLVEKSGPTDSKKSTKLPEIERVIDSDSKRSKYFANFNVENQNSTSSPKPELTDKLSNILLEDVKSIPQKEVDFTSIKSSAHVNDSPEKIAVADKVLHLLMIDSAPFIITDEFMILFTAFTKRLSMMKILTVQHIDLPFQDYLTRNLPSGLSEELLSIVKSYEKFDKVNILPLKSVPKLMEVLNVHGSVIEALYVSGKCFDLRR